MIIVNLYFNVSITVECRNQKVRNCAEIQMFRGFGFQTIFNIRNPIEIINFGCCTSLAYFGYKEGHKNVYKYNGLAFFLYNQPSLTICDCQFMLFFFARNKK